MESPQPKTEEQEPLALDALQARAMSIEAQLRRARDQAEADRLRAELRETLRQIWTAALGDGRGAA